MDFFHALCDGSVLTVQVCEAMPPRDTHSLSRDSVLTVSLTLSDTKEDVAKLLVDAKKADLVTIPKAPPSSEERSVSSCVSSSAGSASSIASGPPPGLLGGRIL